LPIGRNANCYPDTDPHGNGNTDRHSYANTKTYSNTKSHSISETPPNSGAAHLGGFGLPMRR
jgi:hypothetical protein